MAAILSTPTDVLKTGTFEVRAPPKERFINWAASSDEEDDDDDDEDEDMETDDTGGE